MRVDESCNSRWRLTANSHPLSSSLNWFKFWWELMRVCARLTSHESWWELQNCCRFALCSSRLSKIVQSGPVNKHSQQNLIFTKFVWMTGVVNSHQLSPRLKVSPRRKFLERTLVQTLASQLSSTLILVWPGLTEKDLPKNSVNIIERQCCPKSFISTRMSR